MKQQKHLDSKTISNTIMLTDNEKNKIRAEEAYRSEVKSQLSKPKGFSDKIDGPIKLLQGAAIAIGIFATLIQYISNSRKEREEAAREYQKSFYQEQMKVYAEAVEQASVISTAVPESELYNTARQKFLQLFWGRMSMFEDKCVEAKMVLFRKLLLKFEQKDFTRIEIGDPCSPERCTYDSVDQVTLKKASLLLAHQSRIYTIKTWLPLNEQKEYNIDSISCSNE